MKFSTREIANITGAQLIGDETHIIKHFAYDSRKIYSSKNTAFIAINTAKDSGEKYIESAVAKNIKVIISEKFYSIPGVESWIIVQDTVSFLKTLAQYHLKNSNIKTIGVTGSNGKTIVKEWLFQVLNEKFSIVKSPKSFNSQVGLPLSILEIRPENELGIFEVGISKPGEMASQEQLLHPNIGILTHIGSAHSVNFDRQEQLIDEKITLFKHSDTIIFNGDNPLVYNKIQERYSSKRLISYGLKSNNTIFVKKGWDISDKKISVQCHDEEFRINIQQHDEATINNILCVVAVMWEFNYAVEDIIAKLNLLRSVEMRLESVEGVRNNLIINDSFNLDLDSLVIAFQFIKEYKKDNKTLILTDFLESKDSSEDFYRYVADLTNQQNFNQIFLIGDEITKFKSFFTTHTYSFPTTDECLEHPALQKITNSLVLLKGARKFEIEKINNVLEYQKHDTVLEVKLSSILYNINVHRSLLKPETKIMAMVKAYSYGLGDYEIAEFLQHHHIDYLGVAYADEGVILRKKGITTPVMVMNPEQHSYNSIIDYNLEPEIYSLRVLKLFYDKIQQKGIDYKYPIHIKLETGMNRLGFKEHELDDLLVALKTMKLKVVSIFSHLSTADDPTESGFVIQQSETFERMSNKIINALGYQPMRHLLNSAGIAKYPEFQYDMVRIGIGMFGISPDRNLESRLQDVVSFKTVISQIFNVNPGESVGYNRKFKAVHVTRIATLPVGYADGIPRIIGNGIGHVNINGNLVPIVGNVCMDMLMVDVTGIEALEGDPVEIFSTIDSLKSFAEYGQTIPYEVLTSISRRVKRIYIKN